MNVNSSEPLLRVTGLAVSFGALKAVDRADVSVGPQQVIGLIGPNGAGKTSLLDGISGFVRARGSVQLSGEEIQGLPAYKRVRRGLGRTFQTGDALRDLSIGDLLDVHTRDATDHELLAEVLKLLHIPRTSTKSLAELPAGMRRLASIAMAVATAPRVLMLDEPAAGLNSEENVELTRVIHFLRDRGLGILVIDHNVGFVSRTCDYVHAMHLGKMFFFGTPAEMHKSKEVATVYLGEVPGV